MPIPLEILIYLMSHQLGNVVSAQPLQGGIQSRVQRLRTETGHSLILKQHDRAPADWYAKEAEGLALLNLPGCPRVPNVLLVDAKFLLLEDLTDPNIPSGTAPAGFWEAYGRQLAMLHLHTSDLHGFAHNNYLGLDYQDNTQTKDGATFFINSRVLRYLDDPRTDKTLTSDDRKGVLKLCDRIRNEFPHQPASLCHGDLWVGNMLVGPAGMPAYIDPAVHYGWAEAEISLTRQFEGVPDSFYEAYNEINPLHAGWEERMCVYELKEILALIAQFGDEHDMVRPLRSLIAKFG